MVSKSQDSSGKVDGFSVDVLIVRVNVERGMFQNAEHVQNEKCGALKMRSFESDLWVVGIRRF